MSCSSSCCADAEAVNMFCSWPDLYSPKVLDFDRDFLQPEFNPFETIKSESQTDYSLTDSQVQPLISTFSSQELQDPSYLDVFLEPLDVSQLDIEARCPFGRQFFDPMGCCSSQDVGREKVDNPESFFSEFPADIFDHIEPLPSSPENWFVPFIAVKCWKLCFAFVAVKFIWNVCLINWRLVVNVVFVSLTSQVELRI